MTDDAPPPSLTDLRVSPVQFDEMVDRSAGGPAYRRLIRILYAVVAALAVTALAGVVVTLLALGRFAAVLERLDENAAEAAAQRKLLVECTTPSPAPGAFLPPGDDGRHECFDDGQARGLGLVALIGRTQLAIAACERAPNLEACVVERLGPSSPLGPPATTP